MKKITNETILEEFAGFDMKATIKVNYNGMKGKTYEVYERVGTRVTIKLDRLIDFNINEVDLRPISYCKKESNQIRAFYLN